MGAKPKPSAPSTSHPAGPLAFARFLLLIALLISGYLGWISFTGAGALGCGPESGCADVLKSRWAYWLGVPVSLFGLATYACLMAATFRMAATHPPAARRQAWLLALPAGILVLGGALWFTGLQVVVIKSFCPWCLAAHGSASLAAILLLARAPRRSPAEAGKGKGRKERPAEPRVQPAMVMRLTLGALAGLAVLAAGQVLHKPKTFAVNPAEGPTTVATNAQAARVLSLFGGRLSLKLDEVPLIGRVDAPHVMVELHDYTCKGCRQMHHPLLELQRAFSNELAIVSLPLPLDAACNPLVQQTPQAHVNACHYARLGLAIWRAAPEMLPRFDDWVFAPTEPPSVEETTAFAATLVGEARLQSALQDPVIDQLLRASIQIFAINMQTTGRSSMPQFVMGTNVVFGSMTMNDLAGHVTNQFGLTLRP